MKVEKVSELTTNRLSVYLRCLNELAEKGQSTISSAALARKFNLNSAQIRKDLACFGEFGTRGVGYSVDELREHLKKILGLGRDYRIGIIGAGRIGTAIADYYAINRTNFQVVALFDSDPSKIGKKINKIEVSDVKNFSYAAKRDNIEIAIIAVPAEKARAVLEKIVKAGIKAVLNVAPVPLTAAEDVKVKSVDLTISLESLSFHLSSEPGVEREMKPISRTGRKL